MKNWMRPILGLGLSISKVLIERHDGVLKASSPGRDRGATLSLMSVGGTLDLGRTAAGAAF